MPLGGHFYTAANTGNIASISAIIHPLDYVCKYINRFDVNTIPRIKEFFKFSLFYKHEHSTET